MTGLLSFSQYYQRPMMDGYDGVWGLGMLLFWAIVLIAIAVALSYAFRRHNGNQIISRPNDPLDIAKERYARGEIKQDEYERIKKTLLT